MTVEEITIVRCGNCDWQGPESAGVALDGDWYTRLDAGGTVPHCECPSCEAGAFCYAVKNGGEAIQPAALPRVGGQPFTVQPNQHDHGATWCVVDATGDKVLTTWDNSEGDRAYADIACAALNGSFPIQPATLQPAETGARAFVGDRFGTFEVRGGWSIYDHAKGEYVEEMNFDTLEAAQEQAAELAKLAAEIAT